MRRKILLFGDSITEEAFSSGGWAASLAPPLHPAGYGKVAASSCFLFRPALIGMPAGQLTAALSAGLGGRVAEGYSGYNTRWAGGDGTALWRMWAPPKAARGGGDRLLRANDACIADRCGGFQSVPLDEYRQNLKAICSSLKERWPDTAVILITPPPIDEEGRLKNPYVEDNSGLPDRTNESAGAYARACGEVAKESGIQVIDIWSKMQQYLGWEKSFLRT
ncbi:GDSL esterase/lipase At5g45920 isoform X2 [Asparagus officinalis]|uniref:GDSL esterase/lipase At5g45920 isoform X2 n=1 Tax=Asparagus officinalis TaxID=4686 RepID=UPI00098E1AF9|nr:GDSL esterase/lipase At5g45920 isoform X2 [Asparagus officinalis]